MIAVDAPRWTRKGVKVPRRRYSHLAASSLAELHAFAESIGVKRHFFDGRKLPHYDITEEQQVIALAAGAILVPSREIVKIAKTSR